jgi:hypothetical protein
MRPVFERRLRRQVVLELAFDPGDDVIVAFADPPRLFLEEHVRAREPARSPCLERT